MVHDNNKMLQHENSLTVIPTELNLGAQCFVNCELMKTKFYYLIYPE